MPGSFPSFRDQLCISAKPSLSLKPPSETILLENTVTIAEASQISLRTLYKMRILHTMLLKIAAWSLYHSFWCDPLTPKNISYCFGPR